ncbi:DUF305 domain-containing protein [Nocardioides taihuensis]|uniref:DUF305 domain-containing protein n=1 Tax=Nocardioides taihuensis TaxID=1835606 RepID=A0ABW0BCZ9_9ACTN
MTLRRRLAAGTVLAIVGMLALSACGGDDDSGMEGMAGMESSSMSSASGAVSEEFNAADVTFATDMIPHHQQAVEMAKLAAGRAQSAEVQDLADQILQAQGPEIDQMTSWLQSWGKPVPEAMSGMDMSGSMPGMMSPDDMDQLQSADGSQFDQMFLTMMIEHHRGAIAMAQTEQSAGANEDAIALAEQIEQAQTEEIATMKSLLR